MDALDFSPVRKAGLTQEEFAKMVGVSRVTVNTWLTPNPENVRQPHHFVRPVVALQLQWVVEALEMGALPVPGTVRKSERDAYIRQALAAANSRLLERTRLATTL